MGNIERHRGTGKWRRSAWLRVWIAIAIVVCTLVTGVSGSSTTWAQESIALVPVVGGLDAPVQVTNAGDGSNRLFVVERPGRLRVIVDGELQETLFLDLTDRVLTDDSEQGLLSLAFHPDYENNGELFVFYTANDWSNTVERFVVSDDPNIANRDSGEIVLEIPDRERNHNGGSLVFGPDDMLYISTGDEGSGGDPYGNAQSLMSLFGKILRIDIDAGDPYAIPPDNPFVDNVDARPEIWAYGLRNPWRISFDRQTNDLWVADVGQSMWEEVNHVPAGTGAARNFGWNAMEGLHCYEDDCDQEIYTLPVAAYDHDNGCSVTGGHVYRGSDYPSLAGRYFYGDYCSGLIWSLTPDGDGWSNELELDSDSWITSFGEDEAGELYLVDLAGVVYQVTTSGSQGPAIDNPAFRRTWERTDNPVSSLVVDRTWMWGPGPITAERQESYAESPGGSRTVQYFDKSRMEDNAFRGADPWDVTNGLLVVEMVEGFYQTGDNQRDDTPTPAEISIAGDLGQHPTYAYIEHQRLNVGSRSGRGGIDRPVRRRQRYPRRR